MKITLIDLQTKKVAVNKTMAGGFGTASLYGSDKENSFFIKLLEVAKKRMVKIPLIEFGYLSAIFHKKKHNVSISFSQEIHAADLYIIYISLVEFNNEIEIIDKIRRNYTNSKICLIGTMVSVRPELFSEIADFHIVGECEKFFMKYSGNYMELKGRITSEFTENLDDLPYPDWSIFKMDNFVHYPFFGRDPVFPVLTSRGCFLSCKYYCAYPLIAGGKIRFRRIENVVDELKYLINRFRCRNILFRDANFSIDLIRAKELCRLMIKEGMKIKWACETHLSFLDKEFIDLMYESGGRAITVGIETRNLEVIKKSKRYNANHEHIFEMLNYCNKKRIKIMAGYIIGQMNDSRETILDTLCYAKMLNTDFAQFYVSTPYPGTDYFKELRDKLVSNNWEDFNTFSLVFKHPNLSKNEIDKFKKKAFIEYYFRISWFFKFLRGKIYDIFDRG